MFYLFLPVFVTNAILKKYPDHRVPESWPLNSLVNLKLITEFVKRELSYAVK
jgi:hypothetical protein